MTSLAEDERQMSRRDCRDEEIGKDHENCNVRAMKKNLMKPDVDSGERRPKNIRVPKLQHLLPSNVFATANELPLGGMMLAA